MRTLTILQHGGMDLLLDFIGQTVQISGPCMSATGALDGHDSEAFHDEQAALVMAFRTFNWERVVRVRHGSPPKTDRY